MRGVIPSFFMQVNSICILGGGTSGFATASLLAKFRERSGLDFNIKVVYSPTIGSIGVGESTIFSIRDFFNYLGLEDKDWMPSCKATYKTSIRFDNFYKKGRYFHYPFGKGQEDAQWKNWFILKDLFPEVFTPERAHIFFHPQSIMSEENKLIGGEYLIDNTAYHFDANLLQDYLRKYSEDLGVEVVNDTFYGTEQDKYGNIESIVCDDGTYRADLFVDCSGFKSLLLGKMMREDYISYSNTLINDKAITAHIPYTDPEKQLKNHTNCVALNNGWCWSIPLWDRMSYGYVHTNMFASEEEIEKEFFEHIGQEIDYKTVHIKTGRYKRGWVKNVVGVGLAYGFIEPLESTSIATTLENIYKLLELLSKRDLTVTQVDRDLFNHAVSEQVDSYKEFIDRHYYMSSRDDTDYWRFVTDNIDYKTNTKFLNQMIINRDLNIKSHGAWSGNLYLCCGLDYSCFSKAYTLISNQKKDELLGEVEKFESFIAELKRYSDQQPSSYQYQKETLYLDT